MVYYNYSLSIIRGWPSCYQGLSLVKEFQCKHNQTEHRHKTKLFLSVGCVWQLTHVISSASNRHPVDGSGRGLVPLGGQLGQQLHQGEVDLQNATVVRFQVPLVMGWDFATPPPTHPPAPTNTHTAPGRRWSAKCDIHQILGAASGKHQGEVSLENAVSDLIRSSQVLLAMDKDFAPPHPPHPFPITPPPHPHRCTREKLVSKTLSVIIPGTASSRVDRDSFTGCMMSKRHVQSRAERWDGSVLLKQQSRKVATVYSQENFTGGQCSSFNGEHSYPYLVDIALQVMTRFLGLVSGAAVSDEDDARTHLVHPWYVHNATWWTELRMKMFTRSPGETHKTNKQTSRKPFAGYFPAS